MATAKSPRTPRTIALLAAGLAALLAIVITTFWLSERAQSYSSSVIAVRDLRVSAVELRNGLLAAESSQRGYLYSGNEVYLAPFDSSKALSQREAEELNEALVDFPDLQAMGLQLSTLVQAKVADMEETIALKREGRDEEALDLFLTNRGKLLMDQANLFVTGVVDAADTMLVDGAREQTENAEWMRWVSIAGALVVVLVVAGAVSAFRKTTLEVMGARDEVRAINESLERRVEERTSALKSALERTELLLKEVNHRIANSLALVASLVRMQGSTNKDEAVKAALGETQARISAIASVHKRLYESGEVGFVELDAYLSGLLDSLAASMRADGRDGLLTYELQPVRMTTDASINLGIVVTELVTNAYKYAYPDGGGDIRVGMHRFADDQVEIVVEDDGVGRGSATPRGTGLGTRIVKAMATSLGSEVQYLDRKRGTAARLSLRLPRSDGASLT
ncbi:MAG: CHASE3 domain-containing protein [Acidobacteria bacterium]|nr:CHASE3 domain-containing protein [Acidobacteriota bacterium]MBX3573206.1 CHASE3 domain-containing protein [Mesorhizobium sp.]